MPNEIVMPRLGWTMEVGTVVEWLKASGDPVEAGEHIFAVESDKAITEVESLDSGVLYIPDATPIGVEVPVGAALAFILAPGETPPAYTFGGGDAPEPQDLGSPIDDDIPTDALLRSRPRTGVTPWRHAGQPARTPGGRRAGRRSRRGDRHRKGRPHSRAGCAHGRGRPYPRRRPNRGPTPSVRKLAEEIGVDLRTVPSSRPGGRITRADLTRDAATPTGWTDRGNLVPDQSDPARDPRPDERDRPHGRTGHP